MIVVFDASTFVSAALKAGGIPEWALLRAVTQPNRLILSRDVETEYRKVISCPKSDRFVPAERRRFILDIVIVAGERVDSTEYVKECTDPKDDKYLTLAAAGHTNVIVSIDVRHLLSMHPLAGHSNCFPCGLSCVGVE